MISQHVINYWRSIQDVFPPHFQDKFKIRRDLNPDRMLTERERMLPTLNNQIGWSKHSRISHLDLLAHLSHTSSALIRWLINHDEPCLLITRTCFKSHTGHETGVD